MATHDVSELRKHSCLEKEMEQGRDRISELPDEILCQVLESLSGDITDVVKTSFLSKRWKGVWPYISVVHIRHSDNNVDYPDKQMKNRRFAEFVTALFNRLQPLRNLKLSCSYLYTKEWTDIVTNKLGGHVATLEELDLKLVDRCQIGPIDHDQAVKLPLSIFTAKKLEVLKIDCNVKQLASRGCSLPCLKVLHLSTGHKHYGMDLSSVQDILAGCPILEELHLSGAAHNCTSLCIKSSSLKRLKVMVSSYRHKALGFEDWTDIVTNKLGGDHVATLEELDLKLPDEDDNHTVKLPPGIFTAKKLSVLKIDFNVEQLVSRQIWLSLSAPPLRTSMLACSLPCLKVLHLSTGHEHYQMDLSSVQNVLAGCPVLEELYLSGSAHNCMSLCIDSSSLKILKLTVSSCNSTIKIDASNLEELDLSFNMRDEDQIFITNNSLSIATKVTFDITAHLGDPMICYGDGLIAQFLAKATSTKYLFLSSDVMMNLDYNGLYRKLPMFNNLVDLKLDIYLCDSYSCHILCWFLEKSPNLVRLSIRSCGTGILGPLKADRVQHGRTPVCSVTMTAGLHQLEMVELKDFQGSRHEMKLVRYLLEKTPVLKEMALSHRGVWSKAPSCFHQSVVELPKASAACKITVSE